jgi:tetratricopeptide (TPR) repeat protein
LERKDIVKFLLSIFFFLIVYCLYPPHLYGDLADPLDLNATRSFDKAQIAEEDRDKSSEQLISEAVLAILDNRPLDGRSKLLAALSKDPNSLPASLLLARYYLAEVGHFRLALAYATKAQNIFNQTRGNPPYILERDRKQHMELLGLISQIRLSLDNYAGALEKIEEIKGLGYYDPSLPGNMAWILMKLGRLPDATKVAEEAYRSKELDDDARGQVLNVLGILYSMTKRRQSALEIFRLAVADELSRGSIGQPATPLNNMGEVLREIFEEAAAERTLLRAISMPDGCQHVLPALNLALIYLDKLNLVAAKKSIDDFEGCVAQFALKNGEEHRALVNLARGRIAYHSGKLESAKQEFEDALTRTQWFGKIGATADDLRVAVYLSLAETVDGIKNKESKLPGRGITGRLKSFKNNIIFRVESWWLKRKALTILVRDLNDFEDLYIRNTDSFIEYPTLGSATKKISLRSLEKRIGKMLERDDRQRAKQFYQAYLAEKLIDIGKKGEGIAILKEIAKQLRPEADKLFQLQIMLIELGLFDPRSHQYEATARGIFALNRSALRSKGFSLPLNFSGDKEIAEIFENSNLLIDNSRTLVYQLQAEVNRDEYVLSFTSRGNDGTNSGVIRVRSAKLLDGALKLVDEIFSEETNS